MNRFNRVKEEAERDAALKAITAKNRDLIDKARDTALKLCKRLGSVTSTQVFEEMMKTGPEVKEAIKASDKRWMGAVFRAKTWSRAGWSAGGSHGRPVSVWVHANKRTT